MQKLTFIAANGDSPGGKSRLPCDTFEEWPRLCRVSDVEMATIGREGCTGMQAFFGAKTSSVRLLVQIPGSAAKMSRAAFARAIAPMPSFRNLMSASVQAFLEQALVSVACNGAHSLKERLARWLLMMRDRSDEDALPITHSLLAEMLGAGAVFRPPS